MITLYSRVEQVGNRRVTIHEMLESEVERLKFQRFVCLALGFALGAVPTFIYLVGAFREYCQ